MSARAAGPEAGHDLVAMAQEATGAVEALLAEAIVRVRERVAVEGQLVTRLFDREQRATHGLAWLATYVEAVRQLAAYARAHGRRRASRRDRGTRRAHRARRIPRPDSRRHPHEPGRNGAACRYRPLGYSRSRPHEACRRGADRFRQYGAAARPPGRTHPRGRRWRRRRAGRHAGTDSRGDAQVLGHRGGSEGSRLASVEQLHPDGGRDPDGRAWRVRPHRSRAIRRSWAREGIDVRGLRGTGARLYRRRLARHPFGDRGGTCARQRHRGTKAQVAAEDRVRRRAADRGLHRAQYRVRPRLDQDARTAARQCLQGLWQQNLDHASGARRPDDAAGAHESEGNRLSRTVHAAGGETAGYRCGSLPRSRNERHRDRGARLSRHEGI